jgi:hypothetical protein
VDGTYPCVAVEDIDVVAGVQVVDGTFSVDLKGVWNNKVRRNEEK